MEELGSCELGTLQYWENRYKAEIKNFSSHGDPGEIWFGEDIVDRIIRWMIKNVDKNANIVDLGCGNGMLLVDLANEGFSNLTGLDYSEKAVDLAKSVADQRNLNIILKTFNILDGLEDNYNVIHDKGTYDAISLSENSMENRTKYIESVYNGLENVGLFIITSCNWTHSELEEQFKNKFEMYQMIPTPQFKFGGKTGSVVSICVFKKVPNSL